MRIVRASRGIHVPHDPENPDNNSMRLVQPGLLALIPDSFVLPEGYYIDIQEVQIKKSFKDSGSKRPDTK